MPLNLIGPYVAWTRARASNALACALFSPGSSTPSYVPHPRACAVHERVVLGIGDDSAGIGICVYVCVVLWSGEHIGHQWRVFALGPVRPAQEHVQPGASRGHDFLHRVDCGRDRRRRQNQLGHARHRLSRHPVSRHGVVLCIVHTGRPSNASRLRLRPFQMLLVHPLPFLHCPPHHHAFIFRPSVHELCFGGLTGLHGAPREFCGDARRASRCL